MQIDVNGTRLWFDVDGPALVPDGNEMRQRPTVVLVHGGPGGYRPLVLQAGLRSARRACAGRLPRSAWARAVGLGRRCRVELRDMRRRRPRSSATRSGSNGRSSSDTRWADRSSCSTGRATRDMRPGSSSNRDSRGGTCRGWSRASAASRATRSPRSRGAAYEGDEVTEEEWRSRLCRLRPPRPGRRARGRHAEESRAQLARDGAHPPSRHRRSAEPCRRSDARVASASSTP